MLVVNCGCCSQTSDPSNCNNEWLNCNCWHGWVAYNSYQVILQEYLTSAWNCLEKQRSFHDFYFIGQQVKLLDREHVGQHLGKRGKGALCLPGVFAGDPHLSVTLGWVATAWRCAKGMCSFNIEYRVEVLEVLTLIVYTLTLCICIRAHLGHFY